MKFKFFTIKKILLLSVLSLSTFSMLSQSDIVSIRTFEKGSTLVVNGDSFMINGMNWDMIPIGKDAVNTNFWNKPDELIKAGLESEMSLLKEMNVNAIRHYSDIPSKWVQYIFENYGIYTMLNHSFGRYGLTINGVWEPITDYSNDDTQKVLLSEIKTLVNKYKNTPGLLLYLLGNENNYGLFWSGAETEDFPEEESKKEAVGEKYGRPMYKLMNLAAKKIKELDSNHPVAICNGDDLFIDIVAEECRDIDIFGVNSYRGASFTDLFKTVKETLNKPLLFTEFGADAFNAISSKEDQRSQANYLLKNWKEIYENAAGLGKYENTIGGFTFQFSDGWWKYDFDHRKNVSKHDTVATWSNGGYSVDLEEGKNNMNEEWFGVCAKGPTDNKGLYNLYPRAAYYVLQKIHQFNPYKETANTNLLHNYFKDINLTNAIIRGKENERILANLTKEKDSLIIESSEKRTSPMLHITFDDDSKAFNFMSFNGASFKIINNPQLPKNNISPLKVGKITNSGNNWEGNYIDLKTPIHLEYGNTITVTAYSEKPLSLLLKLEKTNNKTISTECNVIHTGNGWEELKYTFSSSKKYNRLVIFIDGPGTTSGSFYIDDITQSNSKIQLKK
ncbi:MAG: glycoside hydrolase family 2 TIM barrel-domain containing protein [Flavobacteriaceae bacterium]